MKTWRDRAPTPDMPIPTPDMPIPTPDMPIPAGGRPSRRLARPDMPIPTPDRAGELLCAHDRKQRLLVIGDWQPPGRLCAVADGIVCPPRAAAIPPTAPCGRPRSQSDRNPAGRGPYGRLQRRTSRQLRAARRYSGAGSAWAARRLRPHPAAGGVLDRRHGRRGTSAGGLRGERRPAAFWTGAMAAPSPSMAVRAARAGAIIPVPPRGRTGLWIPRSPRSIADQYSIRTGRQRRHLQSVPGRHPRA